MHFVLNCFNEVVEINLRSPGVVLLTLCFRRGCGDGCGSAAGRSSADAAADLHPNRGQKDGRRRRVSQQLGASENLWEFETPLVERSQP